MPKNINANIGNEYNNDAPVHRNIQQLLNLGFEEDELEMFFDTYNNVDENELVEKYLEVARGNPYNLNWNTVEDAEQANYDIGVQKSNGTTYTKHDIANDVLSDLYDQMHGGKKHKKTNNKKTLKNKNKNKKSNKKNNNKKRNNNKSKTYKRKNKGGSDTDYSQMNKPSKKSVTLNTDINQTLEYPISKLEKAQKMFEVDREIKPCGKPPIFPCRIINTIFKRNSDYKEYMDLMKQQNISTGFKPVDRHYRDINSQLLLKGEKPITKRR